MAENVIHVDEPSTCDVKREEREDAVVVGIVEIKTELKDEDVVVVDDQSSDGGIAVTAGSQSTEPNTLSSTEDSLYDRPHSIAKDVQKYFELFGQGRPEDVENHIKNAKNDLDSKISSICAKMADELNLKRKIVEINSSPVHVVKEKKFVAIRLQSFFYHNK